MRKGSRFEEKDASELQMARQIDIKPGRTCLVVYIILPVQLVDGMDAFSKCVENT